MPTIIHQDLIEGNGCDIEFEVQITCSYNYDSFIDDIGRRYVVDDQYVLEEYEILHPEDYTADQLHSIDQLLTTKYLLTTFQKCIKHE